MAPDIYHIINFMMAVVVPLILFWRKIKPRDWSNEIVALQTKVDDMEHSLDRIEISIEAVKNILMSRGNK